MILRLRKGESGQALVEMALVLPLFFLLLFGVIEMGRVGYAYITLCNAVREGGRTAAIGGLDPSIENSVQKAATYLDLASLTIIITPSDRYSGEMVTVEVTYPVQLIIPIISNVIPNPVVLSSSIKMRLE